MNVGMNIFDGISLEEQVACFRKLGVNRTFLSSEMPDFDSAMRLLKENGIICETLHAPYNGINAMWGADEEAAERMLARLKDSVDKCAAYQIPVTIVHLSAGRPMPQINERGLKRYKVLFDYALEKGVTVALENQRYLENLSYFMSHYSTPGFCWDTGHEYCCTNGIKFMELYGDRLVALHIHDNRCEYDTDDHLIPFDGKIDFQEVAREIANSQYRGTLMMELGKLAVIEGKPVYDKLTAEEYIARALCAVNRLEAMVRDEKRLNG